MDEMNFFKADIPPEIRSEIFEAEAKTQAGQDRAGRLANYATIVVVGLGIAVFNTFLTGLQDDGSTLTEAGFGWVEGNPLNSFLFTSKIGGAIALISAGLSAVMSEVEVRKTACVEMNCFCIGLQSANRHHIKQLHHIYIFSHILPQKFLIYDDQYSASWSTRER